MLCCAAGKAQPRHSAWCVSAAAPHLSWTIVMLICSVLHCTADVLQAQLSLGTARGASALPRLTMRRVRSVGRWNHAGEPQPAAAAAAAATALVAVGPGITSSAPLPAAVVAAATKASAAAAAGN